MIYNYECTKCKKETTVEKSMKDSSRVEFCPTCKTKMNRIYTAPAITTADGRKI